MYTTSFSALIIENTQAETLKGNSHNLLNVDWSKCLVYFIASLYIIKSRLDKGGMRYFTIIWPTDWLIKKSLASLVLSI